MRRLLLALTPLLLVVACDGVPTSVEQVDGPSLSAASSPQFFPFSATADVCGELVDFTGSFHPVSRSRPDGNGGFHIQFHINAKGTGIGQTSGAEWNWNDAINETGNFRGTQATISFEQSLKLIGKGQAPNLILKASFHVTVTPNGVVNITKDVFSVDCR